MSKIILSSKIKSRFSDLNVRLTLISEFSEVVAGYDSYYFGRNVPNNNSKIVFHIHYVPSELDPQLKNWNYNYSNKKDSYNRTSDNLIFYTKNDINEYLLIGFVGPGGHKIFANFVFLDNLEKVANDFIKNGTVP